MNDIKGSVSPLQVRLLARLGAHRNGRPAAGPLLSSGARIRPDDAVLFRYRLSSAAWGYLVAQGDGPPRLLHFTGHQRAGEHEVAADGQVLALNPARLGQNVVLTMVACLRPLDNFKWGILPSIDATVFEVQDAPCTLDGLLLRTSQAP